MLLQIESLMQMFKGGNLEHKVMSKSGCLSYVTTPWEPIDTDIFERHISYKFHRSVSVFGGEVTCTQRKFPLSTNKGWILTEIMTLHNVPFGNHFRVSISISCSIESRYLLIYICIYSYVPSCLITNFFCVIRLKQRRCW